MLLIPNELQQKLMQEGGGQTSGNYSIIIMTFITVKKHVTNLMKTIFSNYAVGTELICFLFFIV